MTIDTPGWGTKRGIKSPKRIDAIDRLAAVALTSGAGADLLVALRRRYFDGLLDPEMSESALRTRIANQQFILVLEQARDRGNAELVAAAKAKQIP